MNSSAIIKLLKTSGLIESELDESSLTNTSCGILSQLEKMGIVNELEAIKRIAEELEIQYIDLEDSKSNKEFTCEKFTGLLEPEFCWDAKVIPLFEEKKGIVVAFANPLDYETLKAAEFELGRRIREVICEEEKICKFLEKFHPLKKVDLDTFEDLDSQSVEVVNVKPNKDNIDNVDPETPPIIRLVNKIISDAVQASASDIHIESIEMGLEIRFRVDGILQHVFEAPKRLRPYIISRVKLLAGMDIAEKRRTQDGRMRVRVSGEIIDIRASCIPTSYGEKIVLRLLRSNLEELTFKNLGFPKAMENSLNKILNQRGRLILVTGPTGSGKTTTLYSCINRLRSETTNIETVEDPVEYRIPGISQIQVNEAADITFANALRSILRQDPDVIMIGEIRDSETANIALQASQTGHLVLSTLHTNDAPNSIIRLMNLGCKPYLIAGSLAAIVAQRLVRKACPACKGSKCKECEFSGYKGRVALYSYLEVNEKIQELIAEGETLQAITEEARKAGYRTLDEIAQDYVEQGITTKEEVAPYLQNSNQK